MTAKILARWLSLSALLAVVLLLSGYLFYQMLAREQLNQLTIQAKSLVANMEAFGGWVAKQGGVWSFSADTTNFLKQRELVDVKDTQQAPIHAYFKNPALAQREFAEEVLASNSPAKFRMTSHNVMNPINTPDAFETRAINALKSSNMKEYSEEIADKFRYAQVIVHKAACINCHGDPAKAPIDVIQRYGDKNGFGFREGDVAGVISVSIPRPDVWQSFIRLLDAKALGLLAVILLLLLFLVRMALMAPQRI